LEADRLPRDAPPPYLRNKTTSYVREKCDAKLPGFVLFYQRRNGLLDCREKLDNELKATLGSCRLGYTALAIFVE